MKCRVCGLAPAVPLREREPPAATARFSAMRRSVFALVVLCAAAPLGVPAAAQDSTAVEPLDARLFRVVYVAEQPAFAGVMRGAEATAMPVLLGAVPVAWGVTLATGADLDPAFRLMLAEGGAAALVLTLKNVVDRPRPYRALRDVTARARRHAHEERLDPHSFPSGHAALSFALATSGSLSAGRAWVTVPAVAWATAVSLARVWHGVHYPLDVATGAALGAGTAVLVHLVAPEIDGEGATVVPLGAIRIPL